MTLVAITGIGRASQAPNPEYNSEYFKYKKENETYCCPQGNSLNSNGSTYIGRSYQFKQYITNKCKDYPVRAMCTTSKINGKVIQRSEFHQFIEKNAQSVSLNPEAYKKRQAFVEHPYGTIKRQWSFDHITTKKSKQRASADVGFMFIAYNLKRIWSILKVKKTPFFNTYWLFIRCLSSILNDLETIRQLKTKKL